ncbi:MAG: glycosyltransferase family 4 protein [Patescibacteria group bacterium]|nr:glycosyltransferase family 4 protein [Patescibacteria group bacterium]
MRKRTDTGGEFPRKTFCVCVFGFDEREEGGRIWAIRTGLVENDVTVKRCQTLINGFFAKYRELFRKWRDIEGRVDAIYVIFMGYYLMPLAWWLARCRGIPVVLDALVSQYDTEVVDRKRISRFSPRAWFLWAVDFISCFIADAVVVDTYENKKFFIEKFLVNDRKIIVVPVGCRSDLFKPLPRSGSPEGGFVVEFHGGFSPLQGVEYIIDAAEILQKGNENVRFEIVGGGQLYAAIREKARELGLSNVEFFDRKPIEELPRSIARGDVCLGIFGTTPKALRVIPNKVYECLSCGKPVITERSPAALETLRDREEVLMTEPGNGPDLAKKIMELKRDAALRKRLGERAREVSVTEFSPRAVAKPLADWFASHT